MNTTTELSAAERNGAIAAALKGTLLKQVNEGALDWCVLDVEGVHMFLSFSGYNRGRLRVTPEWPRTVAGEIHHPYAEFRNHHITCSLDLPVAKLAQHIKRRFLVPEFLAIYHQHVKQRDSGDQYHVRRKAVIAELVKIGATVRQHSDTPWLPYDVAEIKNVSDKEIELKVRMPVDEALAFLKKRMA